MVSVNAAGLTVLQRMPSFPHSRATTIESPRIAATVCRTTDRGVVAEEDADRVGPVVIGVLVVAAGVAYFRLRPRAEAAIAVAVLGGVGSVIGLSYALDLRGMFSEALDLGYAHYSPGFGVVLACTVAAILIPLGVAAFVLECIAQPPSARPRER
jgi:hypothetical protein